MGAQGGAAEAAHGRVGLGDGRGGAAEVGDGGTCHQSEAQRDDAGATQGWEHEIDLGDYETEVSKWERGELKKQFQNTRK